ncbi:MAG: hypothetical protein GDA53_00460 [Rhodobacteraceae bacterium]|nr:hypothetical protein [Paracoccaceae bacterium]
MPLFTGTDGNDTLNGTNADDTLNGGAGRDILAGGAGADTLNGGAGRDRADYTASDVGVTVTLANAGNGTGVGGHAQGDILQGIEHILGSAFGDSLTGNDVNNLLRGGAGGDTMDGGGGNDRLDYSTSDAAVTVDLGNNTASGGHAQGDVISNFENISGSRFSDILTGNSGRNVFSGGRGADTIDGGNGRDVISYSASNAGVRVNLAGEQDDLGFVTARGGHAQGDKLKSIEGIIGTAHDDVLKGIGGFGANNKNFFRGGGGADEIRGRGGRDTADYRDSGEGVTVSLVDGTVNSGGTAEGDRLYSIENVRGSRFADTLTGDGQNNRLVSEGGADTLTGGAKEDGFDLDFFVFREDWADGTVITDFDLGNDSIVYKGLDVSDVTMAAHDRDGDGTNESTTLTLNSNVLTLWDVSRDDFTNVLGGLQNFITA